MGGAAEVIRETHAKNMVMDGDVSVVETGARADFLSPSPNISTYSPVHVDRVLQDEDTVSVGDVTLTAHKTAGHTRGCTTWTMRSHHPGEPAASFRISNIQLPCCEVCPARYFSEPTVGTFDLLKKLEHYPQDGPRVFIDPAGYKDFVTDAQQTFEQALSKQQAAAAP
jgi:metallo-beta-lactamase class B